MPRIADYSIVADNWVLEKDQNTIAFSVPSNIDPSSRSVLTFMLNVSNLDDMSLKLRINGIEVWNWNYPDGERVWCVQEVVGANVVKPGSNVLSFDSSSGDARMVRLSDIVVWWQANI